MNHENDNEIQKVNPEAEQESPAAEQAGAAENTASEHSQQEEAAALQADPQVEPVVEPGGENKPEQHKFKDLTASTKFRRGSISTAFTVGFIVVVILINVIVSILGQRFPSINLDFTKNSSNTLSEQAITVVDSVKAPITLYILATEAQTKGDQVLTEYGIQYSQVGILASKMAERNSNIKIEYIDLVKNPTFANQYKSDNLVEGDVIVKSDKRYRVINYNELFDVQYSSDGSSQNTYSLVDSALASGVNSAIAENLPIVAFDSGHSEQLDATTYKSLLSNNNFETKDFNLLSDAIPDKTQMIVLGCPTTDYTDEEIKKLDDFLSSTALAGDRSLMVTFHPSQKEMPKLSTFLKEWGIEVPQALVAETDSTKYYSDASNILSNVQTSLDLGTKTDYTTTPFITPQTNPINLLFTSKETKVTYSLAKSNDTSYLVDSNSKTTDTPAKQAYNTAVLSQDTVKSGDKSYKANVIALGSTLMFSPEILSANTFGDGKYVVDLSKYATGTSNTATAITSNSIQTNVSDITLSTQASTLIGFGIFTVLIPLLIAIAGIMVFYKRRHL